MRESKNKMIRARVSESLYNALLDKAQDVGISDYLRKIIESHLEICDVKLVAQPKPTKPTANVAQQEIYFLDKFDKDYIGLNSESKAYHKDSEMTLKQLVKIYNVSALDLKNKLKLGQSLQQALQQLIEEKGNA